MENFTLSVAIFLFATICVGTVWTMLRRQQEEGFLAIQLSGTTGVACLILMAEALDMPSLRDVALVLALLAAIIAIVFVKMRKTG